jgi:Na+/proline symporter
VPTVAIGFNWKRATATAANAAIVTSLIVNFGIEVFGLAIPYGITGGFVALLLSTTLFFGISLASPSPTIDPDIEAVMDL